MGSGITALVIALGTVTCIFLLTAQETIHGLLQAFSSSRFQASDQRKSREKTANKEACSYYAREKVCETS